MPEEALPLTEEAVSAARQSDTSDALARALSTRGGSRLQTGDTGGLEDMREALEISLESGQTTVINAAYNNLATFLLHLEGPEEAVQLMEDCIAMTEARGLLTWAAWSRTTLIESLTQTTSWNRAHQLMDELWDSHQEEDSQISAFVLGWKGFYALHEGLSDRALEWEEQYLERARVIQDSQVLIPATALMSVIYLEHDRVDEALEVVTEFEKTSETDLQYRAGWLPYVAETLGHLDESDRLEAMIENTPPLVSWAERGVGWSNAILAESQGRTDEAATGYAALAEEWSGIFALHEAYTSLGAGRCLAALQKPDEAAPFFARARKIGEGLGAERVLSQIAQVEAG